MSGHRRTAVAGVVAATVAAAAIGCASTGGKPERERGAAWVEVTNANLLDVDVYLVSGGQEHRLGMVATNRRERFAVAARLIAPPGHVRVAADLLASGGSFVSEEIRLEAGDVVRLVVQPDVNTSYVVLE